MEPLYLKALGLGLAGFDPSGGLIAIALLGAGATRRAVALFCITYLSGVILLLSTLSWLLRNRIPGTEVRLFDDHPATKAGVELAVGLILLTLAVHRARHRDDRQPERQRRLPISPWATTGMGIALAVGVVGDPALLAFGVVASTSDSLTTILISQIIAVTISKSLVVLILVATVMSRDEGNLVRLRAWWAHHQPTMQKVLTCIICVVGVALMLNAVWWYTTGNLALG